jgi:hypothetical protein
MGRADDSDATGDGLTRRKFLTLGAYVAPAVMCAAAFTAQGTVFGDGGESSDDGGDSGGGGGTIGCESEGGDGSESSGTEDCTIAIGDTDTGVPNVDLPEGRSLSGAIETAYNEADNKGDFVSRVASISNDLLRDGKISGDQHGAIMSAAGKLKTP